MASSQEKASTQGKAPSVKEGHLVVSELFSDRAAAPSPFGDDVTFPLPVEHLSYKHLTGK